MLRLSHAAFACVIVALCAVGASPAAAEVRTLAISDPQDGAPTVSGQPNSPDVSGLTASYDTAGALSITVTHFHDAAAVDRSQNYAFWASFAVGTATRLADKPYCSTTQPGSLNGHHHVYSTTGTFFDQATVTGLEGTLQFARTASPDNRTITLTASGPALANRDYQCMTYRSSARRRSSVSVLESRYDSDCDCWYVPVTLDVVGQVDASDSTGVAFFNGFGPPPLEACKNGVDDDGDGRADYGADPDCTSSTDTDETGPVCGNGRDDDADGRADTADPGCRGKRTGASERDPAVQGRFRLYARARRCNIDTGVEVLPDLKPMRLFPFKRVKVTVTGPGYSRTRSLPLGTARGYRFKVHRDGTYRVRGSYPGDRWRSKPPARVRHVRVRSCD